MVAANTPSGSWRLAVIGLGLVTIAAYGVAYYSYGVLIDPIHADTGWSSPALGAIFSGVLIIGGGGGLIGGRLVDRVGTRPALLLAGSLGAGAVAAASYQHTLLGFGLLYAMGCGVIAALGFYHVTQPDAHTHRDRGTVTSALRAAWQAPGFRRWVLASLISGAAVDVILVYQVPVMIAAGLPIGAAASIGGLRGLAQLGGRIPLSPVLRRLGARRTIVLSLVTGAVGALLLLASGHVVPAVVYSLLAGASIGAMYTLQGIYTNELVGQADLSLLMGAQSAVFAIGGAAGPVLAGAVFAATGSYTAVVLLTAVALAVSAAVMATPRPPRRARSPVQRESSDAAVKGGAAG